MRKKVSVRRILCKKRVGVITLLSKNQGKASQYKTVHRVQYDTLFDSEIEFRLIFRLSPSCMFPICHWVQSVISFKSMSLRLFATVMVYIVSLFHELF